MPALPGRFMERRAVFDGVPLPLNLVGADVSRLIPTNRK
jgi:hypothetical protein